MQKEFPEIKKSNEGKFTAWAKRNGFKDAMSAANAVMKDTDKYSAGVVKMANYAKNFGKIIKQFKNKKMGYKQKENPITMSEDHKMAYDRSESK